MFDSADKILDFAIQNEQLAADFYTRLADKMNAQSMKDVFLQFAEEEKGHKAKLERVRTGKLLLGAEKKILDLKIGDNLVEIDLSGDLSYQEALIVAMKAEKAAFKLYTNLAAATDDDGLKQIFLDLAQEEAKHKLRFEIEYDDNILTEN
ncbi:MAG: ferritin family protein [bacterium]